MPRKPSKPKTTRRGKNEGSVYRRKDGKWVGQVTVGYHTDTGKPIRKYTYAAEKYIALVDGGMTPLDAHFSVSRLLGHERPDVTNIYLASVKGCSARGE